MSQPDQSKPQEKYEDAQQFVSRVADEADERGYHASAAFLRAEMPDSDVTNFGGSSAEKVVGAIVESEIREAVKGKDKE